MTQEMRRRLVLLVTLVLAGACAAAREAVFLWGDLAAVEVVNP